MPSFCRLLFLLIVSALCAAAESPRAWTDTDGRTITGTVVRADDSHVTLRVKKKNYRWPISKLSQDDQTFLQNWRKEYEAKRAERLAKLVGSFERLPLKQRAYPKVEDYLNGDLFEEYLERVQPQYRIDIRKGLDYKIADQTAALYVPASYDEAKPFGVYVEVTSGRNGYLPNRAVQEVFAKHRLIYVCPHGAGNQAILGYRMGLALDALSTIKADYHIDDKRCFVGGVSGGGVTSTLINYLRPEHFRGALNVARGALLEQHTIAEDITVHDTKGYKAGTAFRPFLPHLDDKHFQISQRYRNKRWAFVSGEKDYNYIFTKISAPQWNERGYVAKYFHVPGMGHTAPPAETLDEALAWMQQ